MICIVVVIGELQGRAVAFQERRGSRPWGVSLKLHSIAVVFSALAVFAGHVVQVMDDFARFRSCKTDLE